MKGWRRRDCAAMITMQADATNRRAWASGIPDINA
jgi:hypothetical protein